MFIHEAIKATDLEKPCIKRESWRRVTLNPDATGIRIMPTNSPDCCIVDSDAGGSKDRIWQPTKDDLTADDWYPVSL